MEEEKDPIRYKRNGSKKNREISKQTETDDAQIKRFTKIDIPEEEFCCEESQEGDWTHVIIRNTRPDLDSVGAQVSLN